MARRKNGRDVRGIFLLDKPQGLSSNEALQKIKRLFGANKAGHTGALDPLATGMLPICFGEATKFSHYLLESDKRYRVTAQLGIRTDTSDSEGQIIQTRPVAVNESDVHEKIALFRGKQKQMPTLFSALKYQGKPLYEYARKGITVPRDARDIDVYELNLLRIEGDQIDLEIHCSKGTYIRTLVDDLGEHLDCGAHVIALHRLHVGHFKHDPMYTLDAMLAHDGTSYGLDALLLPVDYAVISFPEVLLNPDQTRLIKQGRAIPWAEPLPLTPIRMYQQNEPQDEFVGMGEYRTGQLHPKRLIVCSEIE